MAFKKVEESSGSNIPFFAEWEKEQSEEYKKFLSGSFMEPKTIKAVTSGKGFMINFDDEFNVFVWKNSVIGKVIKTLIREESGDALLLCFEMKKSKLSYDLGIDEEIEVALTEDKYDEGIYYSEITSGKPPIAPNENRKYLMSIPVLEPKPPVKLTETKKLKKPTDKGSDGGAV